MLKVPETDTLLGTLSQMTIIYPMNLNPDVAVLISRVSIPVIR